MARIDTFRPIPSDNVRHHSVVIPNRLEGVFLDSIPCNNFHQQTARNYGTEGSHNMALRTRTYQMPLSGRIPLPLAAQAPSIVVYRLLVWP